MNQNYQVPQYASSNTIDKQVKRAEIQQKYQTRLGNPQTAAKRSVWEFVRNLFKVR
jgi:hypothetical protein